MTLPGLNVPAITGVCCALMLSVPFAQTSSEVEHVVEQMRGMSMTIQPTGRMTEREAKRRAITKQLHDLGPSAILALARVLRDGDVEMRQNAALVLSNLGGGFEEGTKPPLDTRAALPALIDALTDDDRDVRAWAAGVVDASGRGTRDSCACGTAPRSLRWCPQQCLYRPPPHRTCRTRSIASSSGVPE